MLASSSSAAFSWGERGHNLVARAAARLCSGDPEDGPQLSAAFVAKELMLGHLANIPDIYWKSLDKAINARNTPTHYVHLESIAPQPEWAYLPRDVATLARQVQAVCTAKPSDLFCLETASDPALRLAQAGTAPFRVEQLYHLMTSSFRAAKSSDPATMIKHVNEALLYGGIMAHFVGDLAQPYHTTEDYDGYAQGLGGIHGYFETELVGSYDLTLDNDVYLAASADFAKPNRLAKLVTNIPATDKSQLISPLILAYALALDSFHEIGKLDSLDRQFALLKPSSAVQESMQTKRTAALRRPVVEVQRPFRDFVVKRLSIAAATLAFLWHQSWVEAGRPDISRYQSYVYPLAPAFIEPAYLNR